MKLTKVDSGVWRIDFTRDRLVYVSTEELKELVKLFSEQQ